jgi:fatty-acyl-CoA synthase
VAYYGALLTGAVAVLVNTRPRFRPAGMREALTAHRITFFAGVTAMIHLMLADPGFDPADLPALRTVCFGGAPVAPAFLADAVERLPGVTFANVWGLTEATSIVTCGGGWLRTGDVGRIDADGYVQVLDRLKDMMIRGGENIYSLEVESALAQHPQIAEVAVVGVPDPVFGERVRAVAVLRPGETLALEELRAWAGPRLADYKQPADLVLTGELPRNANAKVMKKQLAGGPG